MGLLHPYIQFVLLVVHLLHLVASLSLGQSYQLMLVFRDLLLDLCKNLLLLTLKMVVFQLLTQFYLRLMQGNIEVELITQPIVFLKEKRMTDQLLPAQSLLFVNSQHLSQETGHLPRCLYIVELKLFCMKDLLSLDLVIKCNSICGGIWQFSKYHLEKDNPDRPYISLN